MHQTSIIQFRNILLMRLANHELSRATVDTVAIKIEEPSPCLGTHCLVSSLQSQACALNIFPGARLKCFLAVLPEAQLSAARPEYHPDVQPDGECDVQPAASLALCSRLVAPTPSFVRQRWLVESTIRRGVQISSRDGSRCVAPL